MPRWLKLLAQKTKATFLLALSKISSLVKKISAMKIILGFIFDYLVLVAIAAGLLFSFSWEGMFLPLLVIHTFLSFKSVNAQEIAGVLFFGAFVAEVGAGPKLVPFISCRLVRESGLTIQSQFPDEPEKIDKTGNDVPEAGKVFPIRVTHAQKEDTDDPLNERITTETTAVLRMRITRGKFREFYTTVGSLKEAVRQIRDTTEGEIKRQFASKTVAETLLKQSEINLILQKKVDELVVDWEVEIVGLEIVDIGLSHSVNKSMSSVVEARFNKRARIATGEGERKRLILEGEGTAQAKQALLKAEAKGREAFLKAEAIGYAELAAIAKTDEGKFAQAMKVLEQGFAEGNTTFFDSNMILNAAATVESLIAKMK